MESESLNQPINNLVQSNEQPKPSNFLIILLSVLLIISTSVAGFFAYQTQKLVSELRVTRDALTTKIVVVEPTAEPVATESAVIDTSNWKSFESDQGLTINYPDDWVIVNNMYISQKMFDAYSTDTRIGVYNVVEIRKVLSSVDSRQTNKQWFETVKDGAEIVTELGVKRTRIETGNTKSGEQYFIVRNQAGTALDQIRAYIIKNTTLYEIILADYDQLGLESFKTMLKSVTVN